MSTLANSLKRLYAKGKVTLTKLKEMKKDGKINEDEYAYIIS